jgi:hypothetical protein
MLMYSQPNRAVQVVFVHAYTRFRKGKLEWVCSHYRSWPRG